MSYRRAPITEAVIEIRIRGAADAEMLEKLTKRLQEHYPSPPQKTVQIAVELSANSAILQQSPQGYRLTASDGAGLVILLPSGIATSRLPPYQGWESFIDQARGNWNIWKRAVGWREIIRIGVRYVNRIDVPNPTELPVRVTDYLNFGPNIPNLGAPMSGFATNAVAPIEDTGLKLILNAGSADSPLVKTTSFILDIDVSRESGLPQSDEDLWLGIDQIRAHKNRIFEACITDRARELFG